MRDFLALLAALTGLRAPTLRVPAAVSLLAAQGERRGRVRAAAPRAARAARGRADVGDPDALRRRTGARRARLRLAARARALADAVGFFIAEGYVEAKRASAIRRPPAS